MKETIKIATKNKKNNYTNNQNLKGIFFLIIGPSGVGKGSIISQIKKDWQNKNFIFPITATTRQPRNGEVHNKDYIFMKKEDFISDIKKNKFIEYAIIHKTNYYGLPKQDIFDALKNGKNVIRELDIQGLVNLEKIIPKKNLYSIFIMPPSLTSLEQRIRGRSKLSEEEIKRRLNTAKKEIENSRKCDIIITSYDNKLKESIIDTKNAILIQLAKNNKQ